MFISNFSSIKEALKEFNKSDIHLKKAIQYIFVLILVISLYSIFKLFLYSNLDKNTNDFVYFIVMFLFGILLSLITIETFRSVKADNGIAKKEMNVSNLKKIRTLEITQHKEMLIVFTLFVVQVYIWFPILDKYNIPSGDVSSLIIIIAGLIAFLLRYPHEYLHGAACYLIGYEYKISLKLGNPSCSPIGLLKSRDIIIVSIFPIIVMNSLLLCINMFIKLYFGTSDIQLIFIGTTIFTNIYFGGDMLFIILALLNIKSIFIDNGRSLEIYL